MSSNAKKLWLLLLLLIVLVGAGIFALYRSGYFEPPAPEAPEIIAPTINDIEDIEDYTAGKPIPERNPGKILPPINLSDDHIRGPLDAKISMVEYSSLSNPYASLIHTHLLTLLTDNNPDLNWIFRQYPRTSNVADMVAA